MVALAVEAAATERASHTGDRERVPVDGGVRTECLDHARHGEKPVDLLDPELPDVGEDRGPFGYGGGDRQGRDLVERRDLAGSDFGRN